MKAPILLLIFVGLPLLEIYLLIQLGGVIGALPTIGVIVGTTIIGTALQRRQGLETLGRVRASVNRGEMPASEMLEGVLLMLASILLILPGLITDTIGFLCLIPPLRRFMASRFVYRVLSAGNMTVHNPGGGNQRESNGNSGSTIEGHYKRRDDHNGQDS